MTYGQVSPSHRERFEPGSLIPDGTPWLDLDHDPTTVVAWAGAGLTFTESRERLILEAEVPRTIPGKMALDGVRTGKRSGLSVEFRSLEERKEHGLRVIRRATFSGVGLVPSPSYRASRITEVRRRGGGRWSTSRIMGKVNLGRKLSCRCRTGCDTIELAEDSMDAALAEAKAGKREVFAFIQGNYDKPVASIAGGTLKVTRKGKRLDVEVDGLPETTVADDFMAGREGLFYTLRPYFPDDQSEYVKEGTTARFKRADLRAIEIAAISGPTEGLDPIRVIEKRSRRRRVWL